MKTRWTRSLQGFRAQRSAVAKTALTILALINMILLGGGFWLSWLNNQNRLLAYKILEKNDD